MTTRGIWFSLCFVMLVAGISEDDACRFAGLRFARIPSSRVAGKCTNVVRWMSGMYAPRTVGGREVACTEALESVTELFESLGSGLRRSKRLRPDPAVTAADIVTLLAAYAIPGIELLAFGGDPWMEEWTVALGNSDRIILQTAARDWEFWKSGIVPLVQQSEEVETIQIFTSTVIHQAAENSFLRAGQVKGLQAAMALILDLGAFLGESFLTPDIAIEMHVLTQHVPHPYRDLHRLPVEFVPEHTLGVPRDTPNLLRASVALDNLAGAFGHYSTDAMDIAFILLAGWDPSGTSTAEIMLRDQISTSVCPHLEELFSWLWQDGVLNDSDLKVCITLIDFCSASVPVSELANSVELLSASLANDLAGANVTRITDAFTFLSDNGIEWCSGLSALEEGDQRTMLASRLLEAVVRDHASLGPGRISQWKPISDLNQETARVMGRALGLAVRYGADLSWLQLAPNFINMLHPRFRSACRSTREMLHQLGATEESHLLSFLNLALGMQDTIGVGGFEMFPIPAWLARFEPISIVDFL